MSTVDINGKNFQKSSLSDDCCCCVGVRKSENGSVIVVNTNTTNSPEITYTKDEWDAFIAGVKNDEFDYNDLKA